MGINVGVWVGDIAPQGGDYRADGTAVVWRDVYEAQEAFPLLSGIDPYGDTIFNVIQMPRLIEELERRIEAMDPGPRREAVEHVLAMARDCLTAHRYLVFVGD